MQPKWTCALTWLCVAVHSVWPLSLLSWSLLPYLMKTQIQTGTSWAIQSAIQGATSPPRSSNTPSQLRHRSILKTHVNVGFARACVKTVDPEAEEAVWMRYNGFSLMQDQYFFISALNVSVTEHSASHSSLQTCRAGTLSLLRFSRSSPSSFASATRTHTLKHQTPWWRRKYIIIYRAACQSGDPSEYGSRSQFAAHCDPSDAPQLLQLQPICLIISTFCACGFWVKRGTITRRPRAMSCVKNPQWWPLGVSWYQFLSFAVIKWSWCYRFMHALCSLNQIGSGAKTADVPRGDGGPSDKVCVFADAAVSFKSDVWKHFGFYQRRKRWWTDDMQTLLD